MQSNHRIYVKNMWALFGDFILYYCGYCREITVIEIYWNTIGSHCRQPTSSSQLVAYFFTHGICNSLHLWFTPTAGSTFNHGKHYNPTSFLAINIHDRWWFIQGESSPNALNSGQWDITIYPDPFISESDEATVCRVCLKNRREKATMSWKC